MNPNAPITPWDRLIAILQRHGFDDAAKKIIYAPIDPVRAACAWDHYPRCMDERYPTLLRRRAQ